MGYIKFAAEEDPASVTRGVGTPNVSGTALRASLTNDDFVTFEQNMPAGVDAKKIYDTLRGIKQQEATLRAFISSIISG